MSVKRPISIWRKKNLQKIVNHIHENEKTAIETLVKAICTIDKSREFGKTKTHINKISNTDGYSFGDQWAELVENAIKHLSNEESSSLKHYNNRDTGFLDSPPQYETTAYVLASARVGAWKKIHSELKDIFEIKEASLVYGGENIDAIIKIESTPDRINEIILNSISSNQHIFRTQTFHSVLHSRWQHNQFAYSSNLDELLSTYIDYNETVEPELLDYPFNKYIDYVSPKIKEMFEVGWGNKITGLKSLKNSGTIEIKSLGSLIRFPQVIIDAAITEIKGVVVWKDIPEEEVSRTDKYLTAQASRLKQNNKINKLKRIRRVFVIEQPSQIENDKILAHRLGHELSININVRFMEKKEWPSIKEFDEPHDFGIFDDKGMWSVARKPNQEGIRPITFFLKSPSNNSIDKAIYKFNVIWEQSREIDSDMKTYCKKLFLDSKKD